jgi:glycolate oxidase iron-sulfur subunit
MRTHLKSYGHLLHDDLVYAQRASQWSAKLRDIHKWLAEIGIQVPTVSISQKFTYHQACHLCHGQKITEEPRQVLKAIPGLQLVELAESSWCCGSAGIYNTHSARYVGETFVAKTGKHRKNWRRRCGSRESSVLGAIGGRREVFE